MLRLSPPSPDGWAGCSDLALFLVLQLQNILPRNAGLYCAVLAVRQGKGAYAWVGVWVHVPSARTSPPTAFAAHGFRRPRLSPPTAFADPNCSAVTPPCVPGVYLTATACCQGCGHLNVLLKLHRGLQTLELEGNEITGAGVRLLVGAWVMCVLVVMKGGARGWMCGRWLWRGMPSTRGMQSLRL